ncbi:MAG TPA: HEAT repeat domain-containing protein [Terriglobales bacterium]|nr:HEAT repeat domain-containing protein [Terriglobales bacterium]
MRQRYLWIFAVTVCLVIIAGQVLAQTSGDKPWTTLQAGLADKGDNHVIAVRVLGLLDNNAKAVEIATTALGDDKSEVRAAAAAALGQMQAKSAVPKLVESVKAEKDAGVVIAEARALTALGDPLGYAVYYAVLTGERKSGGGLLDDQKKMLHDPKKMAQFGFEQGIGYIPFASIGVGAIKALTKDDSSPVRAAAARILADDPDPKSREALIDASSDKNELVRAAALDALSHRGDPSVIPAIESKLDDDKATVRLTAAAAIIHLRHTRNAKHPRRK